MVDVSVISCWHNRTHDIETSVFSVLDQNGVDFEYIIVDDASCDATYEKLSAINDHRLRLVRNSRNLGFTRSIRQAVALAEGPFIALHGAGDISLPGRLAKQAALLNDCPDVIATGAGVINHDLRTGCRSLLRARRGPDAELPVKYTHGEVMFRSNVYRQVGGYRELFYYSQDIDLWFRLNDVGKLDTVDEVLYERRIFPDGIEGNPSEKALQAYFSSLARYAAAERAAGRSDPVDRCGALTLITQPHSAEMRRRVTKIVLRPLIKRYRFDEARAVMERTPVGVLNWYHLVLLLALRVFRAMQSYAPIKPGKKAQRNG